MQIQLIYLSKGASDFSSNELSGILTSARLKNELLGVTGMLLYHEGSFLQILEGEESVVDGLYKRITKDTRHHACNVLMRSYIDRRSFGEWRMGFINTNRYRNTTLMAGYQDFFNSNTIEPQAGIAHKMLVSFRDGVLKHENNAVEPMPLEV
jgi:hypothetical protein